MSIGKEKTKLLSPIVLIGALFFGGLLFLIVVFLVTISRPSQKPVGVVTAALTIIPIPTNTLTPIPTAESNLPDSNEAQTLPPGDFEIGSFVKVRGTEGAGLHLRSDPGLDSEPLFLGIEDEIFKIEAGPQEEDGYIWWFLVAPFEAGRNGWAVSNYLEIIQEP
jgi:hypothetical protein